MGQPHSRKSIYFYGQIGETIWINLKKNGATLKIVSKENGTNLKIGFFIQYGKFNDNTRRSMGYS